MKKLLIGVSAVVVLLVAAVLVGPNLIDWNKHKAFIAQQAKAATGRDLVINGDIEISVLPSPALVAHEIELSNLPGAASPEMVLLKSVEVRIAFMPLLAGNVAVEEVRLVEPVVELEILADGRPNWVFETPAEARGEAEPGPAPTRGAGGGGAASDGGGFDLQLDNFVLENGTVVYRDSRSGMIEAVEQIEARIAMASLKGPVETSGSLVARNIPLTFNATVGEIIQGRTVAIDLGLGLAAGKTDFKLTGTVLGLGTEPRFKGKLDLHGENLGQLVHGIAGGAPLPPMLSQSFGVAGNLVAAGPELSFSEAELALGEAKAKGGVSVAVADTIDVQVDFGVSRIDLDAMLAAGPSAGKQALEKAKVAQSDTPDTMAPKPAPTQAQAEAVPFSLPEGITGAVRLAVDAVLYNGKPIRDLQVNAELAGGEVTLSQFSAQMPGNAEVALFGFLVAKDGQPQFEGELEGRASDLRGTLSWLGVSLGDLPKDRLRRLSLQSAVRATPEQAQVIGLKVEMDSSKVTGGATALLRARPSVGVELALDRLDLDAYMPVEGKAEPAPSKDKAAPGGEGAATQPAPRAGGEAGEAFAGLKALTEFDANLKATIGSLVYRKVPVKKVSVDAMLYNGALEIRNVSVADVGGASAKVKGTLAKLGGLPEMKDLTVDFKAKDLAPLAKIAGSPLPENLRGLGRVSLLATGNGSLLEPRLDARVKAAGADARIKGATKLLPTLALDADLALKHADVARLARTFGVDYRPSGRLGGLDLKLHAKGGLDKLAITGIGGNVGPVSLAGTADVALAGAKPKVTAKINTSEIPVTAFLPAQKTAALERPPFGIPGLVPASIAVPSAPANDLAAIIFAATRSIDPRWSREPLDLSTLGSVDADLALTAAAIVYDKYRLENADILVSLANAVLRADRLKGTIFGGAVDGGAIVDATGVPSLGVRLGVQNVDVAKAVLAAAGEAVGGGKLGLDLDLRSAGGSVADLVAGLGGKGSLALKGLDVKKSGKGSALSGVIDLLTALNGLGGGKVKGGLADLTGSFTIQDGVARTNDLKLTSGMGNGAGTGSVDLAAWTVDAKGQVEMSSGVLGKLLIESAGSPVSLPFSVKGRLDAPNVKLDTAKLPGKGLAIRGLDKVIKKDKGVGKVLDQVLPGLLGGGKTQQQPQQQPAPSSDGEMAPPPSKSGSSSTSAPKPQDLLRGILGGLGR